MTCMMQIVQIVHDADRADRADHTNQGQGRKLCFSRLTLMQIVQIVQTTPIRDKGGNSAFLG